VMIGMVVMVMVMAMMIVMIVMMMMMIVKNTPAHVHELYSWIQHVSLL
jgi:hypothetical protein